MNQSRGGYRSGRNVSRGMPVSLSIEMMCRAGTSVQRDTAEALMPSSRDNARTPPAFFIAVSKPLEIVIKSLLTCPQHPL